MRSKQPTRAADELRLSTLLATATTILLLLLATTRSHAQPTFVHPQSNFGGHLISEMVPYQPSVVFANPSHDQTPIYLDHSPEFCRPYETIATDVYNDGPVLIQQPTPAVAQSVPPGFRNGVFQKIFFTGSYLPQLDNDSLGFSELETGIVFALPFLQVTTPLLITPRYAVQYLDRPTGLDLPARVYDAEVSFRHLRKFGNSPWAMNAAVTLGHYSDFESNDADAFRVTGQALAVYESSPAAQWVFGVVYLNRRDLSVVPALGVIYQPTPDVKYEAILPRSRISWRLPVSSIGAGNECWAYIGGEFGGGIWSIERPATLTQDLLTYNDYRILVGVERKVAGGLNRRLEVGYVFGRELEFASATPDVRLDDTLFVRAGLTY